MQNQPQVLRLRCAPLRMTGLNAGLICESSGCLKTRMMRTSWVRACFRNGRGSSEDIPQGLGPLLILAVFGTTKVVS